jgi:hypothetical protein
MWGREWRGREERMKDEATGRGEVSPPSPPPPSASPTLPVRVCRRRRPSVSSRGGDIVVALASPRVASGTSPRPPRPLRLLASRGGIDEASPHQR